MAYADLQQFLAALDRDGDLARVSAPVDPHLEVTGIVQRVVRDHGPALLFQNPTRGRMPLLINAFGTERRMAKALGVESLDEIGGRIADRGTHAELLARNRTYADIVSAYDIPQEVVDA